MNCCGGSGQEQSDVQQSMPAHKGKRKHHWMMLLCCIAPIVLAAVLFAGNLLRGEVSANLLTYGMLLLCPLMHLVMIPLMMKKKH